MRFLQIALLVLGGFLFLRLSPGDNSVVPENAPLSSDQLVWSDDFSTQPDGPPNPAKWSYEVGYVRNHESQYYTHHRLENARLEQGLLVIEARRENYLPADVKLPEPVHYTSAALDSMGKADFQYGRIEVKARLPHGQGVWPAIWTLGSNQSQVGWPRCGEIDIMELVGFPPGLIHGTAHYFANNEHASEGKSLVVDHPESVFHVYAIDWSPVFIDFCVDDQKYFRFDVSKAANDGQNPFQRPHFLILNLALGGPWGGPVDDSILPQRMSIAYVRVYQKRDNSVGAKSEVR